MDESGAIAHEIETEGHTVAHVYPDSGDDYAAFIVRAVNSHAALVEALEDMVFQFEHNEQFEDEDAAVIAKARAVLAKL